jgi:hypothetical protein
MVLVPRLSLSGATPSRLHPLGDNELWVGHPPSGWAAFIRPFWAVYSLVLRLSSDPLIAAYWASRGGCHLPTSGYVHRALTARSYGLAGLTEYRVLEWRNLFCTVLRTVGKYYNVD